MNKKDDRLNTIINSTWKTQAGMRALVDEIKKRELYVEYGTFDDFCRTEFGMSSEDLEIVCGRRANSHPKQNGMLF